MLAVEPCEMEIESETIRKIEDGDLLRKIKKQPLSPCGSCECFEKTPKKEIDLFPEMSKFMDEVSAAESYFFNYLYSFKIFRYSRRMLMPVIIPVEYTKAICYNTVSWATATALSPFSWFFSKSTDMAKFVMSEMYKYDSTEIVSK